MNTAQALQSRPLPSQAGAHQPTAQSIRQFAQTYLLELGVLAAMLIRFAPEPYNITSFLILAVVAFAGRTGVVLALAGGWFVFSINPGMVDEAPLGAGARFLVIAAAMVAAVFRGVRHKVGDHVSIATGTTAAVAGLVIVHSATFSLFPGLSIFKAAFWGVVSLTLVSTIRGMSEEEVGRLHRSLLIFFALILVASLAVMPLPEARLRNGVGLQGVLNHPQMFGVFCALAGAYLFGTAIASARPSWLALGLVALALQGVLESGARTGGFALLLAFAGVIGLAVIRPAAFFRLTVPGLFSGRFAVLAAVTLVGAVVNSDAVQQTTDQFVRKNSRADQATAAYDASRGFVIQEMLDNIERRPAQGIGLGVQSSAHLIDIEIDETTGLPLSAPVEKGVMWIALFEELGLLVGAILFGWILWAIARSIHAGAAVATASIAFFFTNFAEATFFSPGGTGMLGLIIFYLGLARGNKKPQLPNAADPPTLPQAWRSDR